MLWAAAAARSSTSQVCETESTTLCSASISHDVICIPRTARHVIRNQPHDVIHTKTECLRAKKKQTSVYLVKRKINKIFLVYIPVAYMADTKRAAAHRRLRSERGVAAYRRTPEREQTILIGWLSDICKKVFIVILVPKPSSN